MTHHLAAGLIVTLVPIMCGPSLLEAQDFDSNVVIELFHPDTSPVADGELVSGTLTGKVTIKNSTTQHAQFYKNFRVITTNDTNLMIDSHPWVRTFQLDTAEFYDGDNLISVHVHPVNTPGMPYITDFSVQALTLRTANNNPSPTGDVQLPTISIDPTMISLPSSSLMDSKAFYTDYEAVTVFDEGVKIDVDQQEDQSNKAQVIPHLGTSVLGRFRWTDRTLPFGDSVGRLIRLSHLVNFQTPTKRPSRIVFFVADASGRANYGFYSFTLPALSATARQTYPLPSTNAKILNVAQGDEIVITDNGSFNLQVEVTNPRLLGHEFTMLSTWVGNRSVAATELAPFIRAMQPEDTSFIVDIKVPAAEIEKLQRSRDGGVGATAFALWNDFDRFRDSNLPVSDHVHLNSIRTTSYSWPYGNPTVTIFDPKDNDSLKEGSVAVSYAVYGNLTDAHKLLIQLDDKNPMEVESFTGTQIASEYRLPALGRQEHTVRMYLVDAAGQLLAGARAQSSIVFSVDNGTL